jgi:cyclohexyl-isocyanide hydratase
MPDFNVGFVIFPGLTQLDFTGPFEVLSRLNTPPSVGAASQFAQSKTHIVAKTIQPILSDRGLNFLPTTTFADCPPLDLICVPGGAGVGDALADAETVDFIRRQGERATYITSVCMGAFLLGAAGLLKGRRAATHWAYVDLLPMVGAIHQKGRVVRDGNVITSGGVSAGIDFGFAVVAELAGPEVAKAIQLGIEYDPSPPFDSGHPDKASQAAIDLMVQRNDAAHSKIGLCLERLRTLASGSMPRAHRVTRTDAEWRNLLTPEQFQMLREHGAERPGSSQLADEKRPGVYSCVACDSALFEGAMKFESGTGWPSFREPIPGAVDGVPDDSYVGGLHTGYGVTQTEVTCATCGSHHGHVFNDGPPPDGLRYCINGAGLKFIPV